MGPRDSLSGYREEETLFSFTGFRNPNVSGRRKSLCYHELYMLPSLRRKIWTMSCCLRVKRWICVGLNKIYSCMRREGRYNA